MKLGHIGIGVTDLAKSKAFYDAIAPHIGLELIDESHDSVRYGREGRTELYIHTRSAKVDNLHLCFEVETREGVDAFYMSSLDAGGIDHGAPGVRENYSPTYYAAFVFDPDGNNIEAVCR